MFKHAIIIFGAGACLAGLIHRITDKPIVIVTHDEHYNDLANIRERLTFPEMIDSQSVNSLLDEIKHSENLIRWQPCYGHPKRKTNKQRCKHKAKLKRR